MASHVFCFRHGCAWFPFSQLQQKLTHFSLAPPLFFEIQVITMCICRWFGSCEDFERYVRSEVCDVLTQQLHSAFGPAWCCAMATPATWAVLDLLLGIHPSTRLWVKTKETPGEHQNRSQMDVHPPQNGAIGHAPWPHRCPFTGNRWPWWMIKPPGKPGPCHVF